MQNPDISFVGVTKRYGDVLAVDDVSLEIKPGSFHSLLGPSGCGKTTSLRMMAGFEQPSAGDVCIKGNSVVGIPAYKRPVNMVFQHYALFPHLSVGDNVGYGLKQRSRRPSRTEIVEKVKEILELVRLPGYENRRAWELSGGQQQRVALARALINRPTVLLLDEPLAALDRKLRKEMQMELQTLQREVGITFILVTHDQEEALSMSDSISIMRAGKVIQTAPPNELYDAPVNRYVADFVGETNFFRGEVVERTTESASLRTESGVVMRAQYSKNGQKINGADSVVVAVRPEVIQLRRANDEPKQSDDTISIPGRIHNRIYLGGQTEFSVHTDNFGEILVRVPKSTDAVMHRLSPGDDVIVSWQCEAALALVDS